MLRGFAIYSIAQLQGNSTQIPHQVDNLVFSLAKSGRVGLDDVGPLGNYTKLPTTYATNQATERKELRYNLLHVVADLLPGSRVAECSRYHVPSADGIDLVHNPNDMTGHLHNVAVCGGKWVCPVCASRKGFEDRGELAALLAEVEARGHTHIMVTFTVSHHVGDRLADLIADFQTTFTAMKSGRSWSLFKRRFGLSGDVVGNEPKYGFVNGWHFHKHVVFIFEEALNQDDLDEIRAWISKRYRAMLAKVGRYADVKHGVVMTVGNVDDYMTKWGLDLELTALESKDGDSFTPFGLLNLVQRGDRRAGAAKALFLEYAEATKGVNRLRFSRGLKARYGLDARDLRQEREETKAQGIASGDILPDVLLETLEQYEYTQVVKARSVGGLVRAVATGKRSAVWEFLESVGVPSRGSGAWLDAWLNRYKCLVWSVKPEKQRELVEQFMSYKGLAVGLGLAALWEDAYQVSFGVV